MKTNIFDLFDPVSITRLSSTFDRTCDINGIHDRTAMWLLPSIMKKTAAVALESQIVLSAKSRNYGKEEVLCSYSNVINYLLETYVFEDFTAQITPIFGQSHSPQT